MKKSYLIAAALIFLVIDCALLTYKIYSKKEYPHRVHKPKKHYKYSVFLTSDDGPLLGSKYLDQIIRDYEVPFTLFLVGKPMSSNDRLKPSFLRYKSNPYVLLANHSYSHANFHYKRFYNNPSGVERDFLKNEKFLGLNSKIGRLPGRNVYSINNTTKGEPKALKAAKLLTKNDNYKFFGWDYELRHNGNGVILEDNAIVHYNKIKELLKSGKTFRKNQIIILMHDQMFSSIKSQETLGELILLLQDDEEVKIKTLDKYKI